MMDVIRLEQLNKDEALRYMGCRGGADATDANTLKLLYECEKEVLKIARPAYVYRVFDVEFKESGVALVGTNMVLTGESVKAHLNGCQKAVLIAATVSMDIDRLIRVAQVEDMTKALVIDSLASVAVEQVCDRMDHLIMEEFTEWFCTYRFGVGYGDLPLSLQKEFLNVLDAPKRIGLNATSSGMLTPTKSVTAIIGLSHKPVAQKARGCVTCNMKDACQFRKKGGRCNE